MKKRILISMLLIATLCLLSSCQKAAGNEQTSGITNVNKQTPVLTTGNEQTSGTTNADRQTSALTTGNNNLDLPFEIDPDKMVAVSDSDIAKLRIGMTMSEVSKILKEKYTMLRSYVYPFCHSWKMSNGDFISVYFEIEGCKTAEDYDRALEEVISGVENTTGEYDESGKYEILSKEQISKLIDFNASAKMVCALREPKGGYIIDETGKFYIGKTDD